jgi:hypothetical protein
MKIRTKKKQLKKTNNFIGIICLRHINQWSKHTYCPLWAKHMIKFHNDLIIKYDTKNREIKKR